MTTTITLTALDLAALDEALTRAIEEYPSRLAKYFATDRTGSSTVSLLRPKEFERLRDTFRALTFTVTVEG